MLAIIILFRILISILLIPVIIVMLIVYSIFGYHPSVSRNYGEEFAKKIIQNDLSFKECLNIRFVGFEILPGFDGTPTTSNYLQFNCLNYVAINRLEPMACTKQYNGSQCVYDISWKILEKNFSFENHGFTCSELYMKNPVTVECQNSNVQPFTYEEFDLNSCEKFSNAQNREWCEKFKAIHMKNVDACDKISNSYFREECYFNIDDSCKKSSLEALREACQARKIIDDKNIINKKNL